MKLSRKELNKLHNYVEKTFTWDYNSPFDHISGYFLRDTDRDINISLSSFSTGSKLQIKKKDAYVFDKWIRSFEDVGIFKAMIKGIG